MSEGPYSDPLKPGRVDKKGIEWWACDPYPTWYRWVRNKVYVRTSKSAAWAVDTEV